MIGADKKLQVYDATSGSLGRSAGGVGDSYDTCLAHEGRLYVADHGDPYRITAYDLDTLDKPQIVYTAKDPHRKAKRLAPCGTDRVCVLDNVSSDAKTTEVAAVDTDAGGQQWRHAAPRADMLRPLGDGASLLVFSGSPSSSLADVGVVGVQTGDGGRTPLGTLTQAYPRTCSWNEAAILCAGDKRFTVLRFAA